MKTNQSTSRHSYMRSLSIKWIRRNRPDVYELLIRLAMDKFPPENGKKFANRNNLPDELRDLK